MLVHKVLFFCNLRYRHIIICIIHFPQLIVKSHGVYMSQLIRYARDCRLHSDFIQRHRLLSTELLSQ